MRMVDLIEKKKRGGFHDDTEIEFIVRGYTKGHIPDYQMSAWLMAVWFNSLTRPEMSALTMAMADSGKRLDLSMIEGVKIDKHSTGGVADTTTLIVAPLVAAAGVKVAKMSGRGLGFTGGTIDKLESIPGFRTLLDPEDFTGQVKRIGIAIMGQSMELAPADGKIYALRDVTATVDSIPLIAASVMSKKLAAGAEKILLDVKYGSGAFMQTLADAQKLAGLMVNIGIHAGRETVAVISSMEEPLGAAIGNSLEVEEAVEILSGRGDCRLRDFCTVMAAKMVQLAKPALKMPEAISEIGALLDGGAGLAKFQEFILAQGGNPHVTDTPALMGTAAQSLEIRAAKTGFIARLESAGLGRAAVLLGAGRQKKDDPIDLTAGIRLSRRCGDAVTEGDLLVTLYYGENVDPTEAKASIERSIFIAPAPSAVVPLIAGIMDLSGWHEAKDLESFLK